MSDVCDHAARGCSCVLYDGHRGDHITRRAVPADAPYKLCPRCGVAQSLDDAFQWRTNGTVFSWCKTCNKAYQKQRRAG